MTTPRSFTDLSDDARMAFRRAMHGIGGEISAYSERAVIVAVPRVDGFTSSGVRACDALAAYHGLSPLDPDTYWFFPLGSDSPADTLRHDGRYRGSLGFWLYRSYVPAD
jgi:hypothetical protein